MEQGIVGIPGSPSFLGTLLKMPPYAKYMKDIITNKRKISEAEISTMLSNYTFEDGVPKSHKAVFT